MQPHDAEWFAGKRVLDVGTGSGRHSREAAMLGSEVVAVDLGRAIDVARRNLPDTVATVQADADDLPFAEGVFDMVMSIGVLHHLPEPERTLRRIVRHARPDGAIQIYLYWVPQLPGHQRVLSLVTAARVVTTRLPHRLLHALCYPLAAGLYLTCVLPYRHGRRRPRLAPLVDALPLKAYADYPFAVCLNDQFDRLSAPIERRYTDAEVAEMLRSAGLEAVRVLPNTGWIGSARRDSVAEALT
jgi:ubiquinone/menaquinone biosynthesis C-methylase UbiE